MYRDPVFRGCTRPAMFLGVPMAPFVLLTGVCVTLAMLALFINAVLAILIIALYLPAFVWMRLMTKQDDQRLNQLILRLRLRVRMGASRRFWGALTYTPVQYRKR